MDSGSTTSLGEKNEGSEEKVNEQAGPRTETGNDRKWRAASVPETTDAGRGDDKTKDVRQGIAPGHKHDSAGEVNMEATITADDIMRAGGFGARDDINCFLPAASDSTDFEASLRHARDYEGPQEEGHRPGLGWTGN